MRAAIFHGAGKAISIEQIPVPECGPDDVLVRIHRCGICGSDVSMTEDSPFAFAPGRLGHEYSGEIVECGRNVTKRRVGQRVACMTMVACGTCEGCRSGAPLYCRAPIRNIAGEGGFGGFGEFVALPWAAVSPLPEFLSFADGALVEPMSCGLHAFNLAGIGKGDSLLVLGAGAMAMSLIFWARRLGAGRIVAMSRTAAQRETLCAMGADEVFASDETEPAQILESLGGQPAIAAECVGKPGMIAKALEYVRPRGQVISMGMCRHAEPLLPIAAGFKDVRISFPVAWTADEFIATIRAFEEERLHPDMMVADVIALEAVPDTISALREGSIRGAKILVDPFQENPDARP